VKDWANAEAAALANPPPALKADAAALAAAAALLPAAWATACSSTNKQASVAGLAVATTVYCKTMIPGKHSGRSSTSRLFRSPWKNTAFHHPNSKRYPAANPGCKDLRKSACQVAHLRKGTGDARGARSKSRCRCVSCSCSIATCSKSEMAHKKHKSPLTAWLFTCEKHMPAHLCARQNC